MNGQLLLRGMNKVKNVKLAHVNSLLLIAIIAVNLYVLILPVAPSVLFWWQTHSSNTRQELTASIHPIAAPKTQTGSQPHHQENRLVIPAMLLDQPVFEGKDARTLNKGLWHQPTGGSPDQGSNTVIAGHRFTYTNPRGTFYHLDKLQVGDEIGLIWDDKQYIYVVASIKTVPPAAVEIAAPSPTPKLTLYTCAPLWSPKDRLVITATPKTREGL